MTDNLWNQRNTKTNSTGLVGVNFVNQLSLKSNSLKKKNIFIVYLEDNTQNVEDSLFSL